MATIVLEVDEALAKAWRNCDPARRKIYEEKIITLLKELQAESSGENEFVGEQP